jgi:A/G-specific adenine glycosylase
MAALAFGENVVALDGNVARVLARVGMIKKPVTKARAELIAVGQDLLHAAACGGSAEALIELGALVCTPKNPKCGECPINADCKAFQTGTVEKFPVKVKKMAAKTRAATALILTNPAGEVFTITRTGNGLFARMLALPTSALQAGEADHPLWKIYKKKSKISGSIEHILTHIKFEISVVYVKLSASAAAKIAQHGHWMNIELAKKQMPKLFAKALSFL